MKTKHKQFIEEAISNITRNVHLGDDGNIYVCGDTIKDLLNRHREVVIEEERGRIKKLVDVFDYQCPAHNSTFDINDCFCGTCTENNLKEAKKLHEKWN